MLSVKIIHLKGQGNYHKGKSFPYFIEYHERHGMGKIEMVIEKMSFYFILLDEEWNKFPGWSPYFAKQRIC